MREGPTYEASIDMQQPAVNVETIPEPSPRPLKQLVVDDERSIVYFDLETTGRGKKEKLNGILI